MAIHDLEPAALHAVLSRSGALDWGEPIPSRSALEAEFGERATTTSLRLIAEAAETESETTAAVLAALPDNCVAHQLRHRVKTPRSLARKLSDRADRGQAMRAQDVLRFTLLTEHHDALVPDTRTLVAGLTRLGWQVTSAHHSYVDGNRYKGIHANLRTPAGQLTEIQFHSRRSATVSAATAGLYAIERDPSTPDADRGLAREHCIALSEFAARPPGIDRLRELGGVPVSERVTGDSVRRQATPLGFDGRGRAEQRQRTAGTEKEGFGA